MMKGRLKPGAISWAFYDWANSAYVLCIVTAIYPVFFANYYSQGLDPGTTTGRAGFVVSLTSLLVFLAAPFLGSLAQQGRSRKRFLACFVFPGCLLTVGLFFVPEGAWLAASAIYLLATFCYYAGNLFYDSLLCEVSDEKEAHMVSGLGFSLGYFGSVILFAVIFLAIQKAESFGMTKTDVTRWSFIAVAAWWFIFTWPLLLKVPESKPSEKQETTGSTLRTLKETGSEIIQNKPVLLFLLAYWFYIDGVHTIIAMASTYSTVLGIPQSQLMPAIILVQVVGVPFALLFGWLGARFGAKPMIGVGLVIYFGVTLWGYALDGGTVDIGPLAIPKIFILGFLIGSAQGGIQSLSRSFFNQLIPREKSAAYFGFYNMIGRSAAILGPLVMGFIAQSTGNPRFGILSIVVLFIIGGALLFRVRPTED